MHEVESTTDEHGRARKGARPVMLVVSLPERTFAAVVSGPNEARGCHNEDLMRRFLREYQAGRERLYPFDPSQ